MSSGGGWRSQSSLIKGGGQGTLAEPPSACVEWKPRALHMLSTSSCLVPELQPILPSGSWFLFCFVLCFGVRLDIWPRLALN